MSIKRFSALTSTRKSVTAAGGSSSGSAFLSATSTGTVTTVGNYKVHTFTTSGTFTVTAGLNNAIEYLIIGGGGSGGFANGTSSGGGGGGAGGFLESYAGQTLGSDFSGVRIYVNTGDIFTVTVGAGGVAATTTTASSDGVSSSIVGNIYSVTALGGGGGGKYTGNQSGAKGRDGGSGGGNGANTVGNESGQCVLSPRQGYRPTSASSNVPGGGAGSASGTGRASSISGSSVTYSAGGASTDTLSNGATNTGGGGTAYINSSAIGGNGGSGIVIIRYLFQ